MTDRVENNRESPRRQHRNITNRLQLPKNSRSCRKLSFDNSSTPSRDVLNLENIMSDISQSDAQRARDKYEFDIGTGMPLPDAQKWEYTVGSVHDGTPNFYIRPPHKKRSTRSIFRPIQAAESVYRTPLDQRQQQRASTRLCGSSDSSPTRVSRILFPEFPADGDEPIETLVTTAASLEETKGMIISPNVKDVNIGSNGDSKNNDTTRSNIVRDSIHPPGSSSISTSSGSSNNSHPSTAESSSESNTRKREFQQTLVTDYFVERKRGRSEEKDGIVE